MSTVKGIDIHVYENDSEDSIFLLNVRNPSGEIYTRKILNYLKGDKRIDKGVYYLVYKLFIESKYGIKEREYSFFFDKTENGELNPCKSVNNRENEPEILDKQAKQ